MKNIIIIAGHGHYASGMKSSLEMICGENEDIYAVDFESIDSNITIQNKYKAIIEKNSERGILIACDLLGGTPFKEASMLAFSNPLIEVVVGSNIGSLIEMSMKKDNYNIKDLAIQVVEASKKNIVHFDKQLKLKEQNSNDGI